MMKNLLSADIPIAPPGGFKGIGTSPLANVTDCGINTLANFISTVVGVMTIVASIWLVITFMTGAVGIISAGSDKGALENSRKKIITGITGFVVVIAAMFIIKLVGSIFGIDVLNIGSMFALIIGKTC